MPEIVDFLVIKIGNFIMKGCVGYWDNCVDDIEDDYNGVENHVFWKDII